MDRVTTPAFTKACGVPQGDAFSVVTSLLMLVPLTTRIRRSMTPKATTRMYLDDLTVRSPLINDMERAEATVRKYAQDWKIQISPKTVAFCTGPSAKMSISRLPYVVVDETEVAGHLPHHDRQESEDGRGCPSQKTGGGETPAEEGKMDAATLEPTSAFDCLKCNSSTGVVPIRSAT